MTNETKITVPDGPFFVLVADNFNTLGKNPKLSEGVRDCFVSRYGELNGLEGMCYNRWNNRLILESEEHAAIVRDYFNYRRMEKPCRLLRCNINPDRIMIDSVNNDAWAVFKDEKMMGGISCEGDKRTYYWASCIDGGRRDCGSFLGAAVLACVDTLMRDEGKSDE